MNTKFIKLSNGLVINTDIIHTIDGHKLYLKNPDGSCSETFYPLDPQDEYITVPDILCSEVIPNNNTNLYVLEPDYQSGTYTKHSILCFKLRPLGIKRALNVEVSVPLTFANMIAFDLKDEYGDVPILDESNGLVYMNYQREVLPLEEWEHRLLEDSSVEVDDGAYRIEPHQ